MSQLQVREKTELEVIGHKVGYEKDRSRMINPPQEIEK